MKSLALLPLLLLVATAATAQSVGIEVGRVLAVDREARLLVLADRSVWSLGESRGDGPEALDAGDRVQFSYREVDQGPAAVIEIEVTHHASEGSYSEIAEGTVLVYDRRARLLILTDKSVWPLGSLEREPPPGLDAGDQVRLEYTTGEDGGISIDDLIVIFK